MKHAATSHSASTTLCPSVVINRFVVCVSVWSEVAVGFIACFLVIWLPLVGFESFA